MGKGPYLPNLEPLLAAGINPATNLPYKFGGKPETLTQDMLKIFRIIDEQDAIRRFTWHNLPDGLDGELIERILYYKESGAFFYLQELDQFYFLPYVKEGQIDVYGRLQGIRPLPFNGQTEINEKKPHIISSYIRKPVYGVKMLEDLKYEDMVNSCVILHDYCRQISQTNLPRQQVNDPLLNVMAEQVPFMRTSLINQTGVKGMRVSNADDQLNVEYAAKSLVDAAKTGDMYVPIVGSIDFQELTGSAGSSRAEEFMMALQSLENLRLATYGLDSGGIFEKKAHTLESEQALNRANVGLVYQDSLLQRQEFCNIVNSIWGLSIWCDASESVLGIDQNLDGASYDLDQGDSFAEEDVEEYDD